MSNIHKSWGSASTVIGLQHHKADLGMKLIDGKWSMKDLTPKKTQITLANSFSYSGMTVIRRDEGSKK